MAMFSDNALDALLSHITGNATALHICSSEPATRAAALSASLGNSAAAPSFTGPVDRTGGGRKVQVDALSGESVTASGTATHWAIISASDLLATGALSASQAVTSGNTFSLAAFDLGVGDPS